MLTTTTPADLTLVSSHDITWRSDRWWSRTLSGFLALGAEPPALRSRSLIAAQGAEHHFLRGRGLWGREEAAAAPGGAKSVPEGSTTSRTGFHMLTNPMTSSWRVWVDWWENFPTPLLQSIPNPPPPTNKCPGVIWA
ncbi:hypothetical protein EYF80_025141 [Liparis tanakae]|uniref:Uncharacterized protein n=1 Tax=Liparis tanakae TaxID=230148 RepID=A0A4Z2HIF1_9TELE|nr:hypothetical protein EYF80_025141 [Liparis tanakae]